LFQNLFTEFDLGANHIINWSKYTQAFMQARPFIGNGKIFQLVNDKKE
jgi:hypothetical protein